MLTDKDAFNLVTKYGALLHGHFVGTQGEKGTGLHMPIYFDGRVLVTYPDVISTLAGGIADLLRRYKPQVVVGMPIGAYTLGSEVARALGARYAMAERADDKVVIRRPAFINVVAGKRAVIVKDTVSAGDTLERGVEGVRGCGGDLVAVGALFSRFSRGLVDPCAFAFVAPFEALMTKEMVTLTREECLRSGQCARGEPINRTPGHGHDLERLVQEGKIEGHYKFV